jgi:transcription-repair coupling factor (superfamily II helicase)
VGFGKTEWRCHIIAITGVTGRLARPTTLLAEQHYQTGGPLAK